METPETIKAVIKEAFRDIGKGKGEGLREATQSDGRETEVDILEARVSDTEKYWWEVIEEWDGQFASALYFTDKEGFRFLLPATLCKALEDRRSFNNDTVYFLLCSTKWPFQAPPHHGHPEYTEYLRSLNPKDCIAYFAFTQAQVHAIALYLRWYDIEGKLHRDLEVQKQSHESALQYATPGNCTLSWEDVVHNRNEEWRILREWLELGNVPGDSQTLVE